MPEPFDSTSSSGRGDFRISVLSPRQDFCVFDSFFLGSTGVYAVQSCSNASELKVCADIRIRIRRIIIRIQIPDSCIPGIIPIAARNQKPVKQEVFLHIPRIFMYHERV